MKSKSTIESKPALFASQLTRRLLPQKLAISSRYLEQSDFFRQTLLVKNFPASFSTSCLLTKIAQIKNTTFSMRLALMSDGEAQKLINVQINNKAAGRFSRKGTEQIKSGVEFDNIKDFYEGVLKNSSRMYYVNIYIEVYAESLRELEERSKKVKNMLQSCYITSVQLIYEQKEGFAGVSPIGRDLLQMSRNSLPSSSLAALYPFSYSSHNDPRGMYLGRTEDGGYVFFDPWYIDDNRPNSSIAITGESGRGKSYLLKKIISQQIARGTTVFILDPEGEYRNIVRKFGGTVLNCAAGNFVINVFEIRTFKTKDEDGDPDVDMELESNQSNNVFFQHLSWMQQFFKVMIPYATGLEITQLMMLVKDMYITQGIDENTDLDKMDSTAYPTFTTLYNFIYDVLKNRNKYPFYADTFEDAAIKKLLLMIRDAYDGSLSPLFNGHTNITNARIINFDIQALITGSEERSQAYMFNVMTYLWNRFLKKENNTMLCIDELYLLMNRENLIIAKYLKDFVKRARKYDASIVIATQQLGDFLDQAIYHISSALFNTPTYKFMFNPGELDYNKIQSLLGLNEGELAYLRFAKKKHCLLKIG
ncbi:MAG: VirB4 family type IV secretion system protein, partial [Acetanaerobacterium sp.]